MPLDWPGISAYKSHWASPREHTGPITPNTLVTGNRSVYEGERGKERKMRVGERDERER